MNISGPLNLVDSVADSGLTVIRLPTGVQTAVINGDEYAFVVGSASGFDENGIQTFGISSTGELDPLTSFTDGRILDLALSLEKVYVGAELFLVSGANNSTSLSLFSVDQRGFGTDGEVALVDTITDLTLLNNIQALAGFEIGNKGFVLATSYSTSSVSIFPVEGSGQLRLTDTVSDSESANLNLLSAQEVLVHQQGAKTFAIVGSDTNSGSGGDEGLSVFQVSTTGKLKTLSNIEVGPGQGVAGLASMTVGNQGYLFASTDQLFNDQIIAYSISSGGKLKELDRLTDTVSSQLNNIETFDVDGVPFLVATEADGGLLILSFTEDEGLSVVQRVRAPTTLEGAFETATLSIGGRAFIVVTSQAGDRVSTYEIGAGNDALLGTSQDDRIVGGPGEDELLGLAGNDQLYGGLGEDVLSGAVGDDLLDGGAGDDVLVGGAGDDVLRGAEGADVLVGKAGVDKLDYAGSGAGVQVDLATATVSGGDAQGDTILGIESVRGSAFDDQLDGNDGANVLEAGAGDDSVAGGGGADVLAGGDGSDEVFGEADADTVDGGAGNDTLDGGDGNDTLAGGDGADSLTGGLGKDRLEGGGGADVIVFAEALGNDVIVGFDVREDRIDLSGSLLMSDLDDVLAAATTFRGNTVITFGTTSLLILGVTEAKLDADNFLF